MSLIVTVRTTLAAATMLLAVGLGAPANAAVTAFAGRSFVPAAMATQVHWEYRHHHRYWVPDRRRGDYRR